MRQIDIKALEEIVSGMDEVVMCSQTQIDIIKRYIDQMENITNELELTKQHLQWDVDEGRENKKLEMYIDELVTKFINTKHELSYIYKQIGNKEIEDV